MAGNAGGGGRAGSGVWCGRSCGTYGREECNVAILGLKADGSRNGMNIAGERCMKLKEGSPGNVTLI
jgi:hypothetical protein